jgi:hypothetical protein
MADVLKGNFEPKTQVTTETESGEVPLEEQFEREALKRLGGSIAFVSRKKVMWSKDEEK